MSAVPKDIKYHKIYFASLLPSEDSFYNSFLEEISKGKCPKKCSIDSSNIYFSNKRNSKISYNWSEKSEKEISNELSEYLKKYCGLVSNKENNKDQTEINEQLDNFNTILELNNWKKIKNRKMRKDLLIQYAISHKNKYNMKWSSVRKLQKILNDAFFIIGTHNSDDIEMKNGKISNIDDIDVINERPYNLRLTLDYNDKSSNTEEDMRKSVTDKWYSFVKGLVD